MKSPAFQFYPDDFMGSGKVGMMTPHEVGVYMLLLCLDWNENGFVFDQKLLARWCRCSQVKFLKSWETVASCFVERDGRMYSPRLELERAKQADHRTKRAAAAHSRWNAHADANALQVECSPSPTPSPTVVTTPARPPNGAHAPVIAVTKVARPPREPAPWMGLMKRAWTLGTLPEGAASQLRKVVGEIGEEEVAARMTNYCDTANPEYATFHGFMQKHAAYANRPAVDPVTGLPNAVGMAALRGSR